MATYSTSLVFCTEEQVFNVAGYTFTGNDTPTDAQVYEFAQQAAGEITLKTKEAGSRLDPPASGISDVALRNVIVRANAVGAAYFAWMVMAKGGDPHAISMRDHLREQWVRLIGGTTASGTDTSGLISTTVATSAGSGLVRTDQTAGYVGFPTGTTSETLGREFAESDVD